MIVSIMQPYFFPYIGYFQLIAQSDVFVFYEDVQYIKGGWINRNRVLRDGAPAWVTVPVASAAHALAINERSYQLNRDNVERVLRQIEAAYKRAPRFEEIFVIVREIMEFSDANVAAFNCNLVRRVADHLGLRTHFVLSSVIDKDARLSGEERVVDICKHLGATCYVNPIGGMSLYHARRLAQEGIDLRFLESTASPALDRKQSAQPFLSIIDTLMRHGSEEIADLLKKYRLIEPDGLSATPLANEA